MKFYLPLGVAVVVLAVSTAIEGVWSERWVSFEDIPVYAEQLKRVPMQIGDWKGKQAAQVPDDILAQAGAVGNLSLTYQNSQNEEVAVFLVCGRTLDMLAHSPQICYPAAGYEMKGEPARQPIETEGGGVADFFTTIFEKSDPFGVKNERVYWSFCGANGWEASSQPTWTFGGQPVLYKLYVIAPTGRDAMSDRNPCTEFIRVLIPELNRAFAPVMKKSTEGDAREGDSKASDSKSADTPPEKT